MTTAAGSLNGFPLNGNFDASIVGIAVPLMDLVVDSQGVTVHVGVLLSAEIAPDLAVTGLDATVGMTFQTITPEVSVTGLDADTTFIEVNAEDLTPNNELTVTGLDAVVGILYGPPSMRGQVDPLLPNMAIGQEYTLPVLFEGDVTAITPAWFIYAEGQISQTLQIDVVDPTIQFTVFFEIEIFESGQVTQVIQQDIINQDIQVVSQTFEQIVFETGQPSVTLQQEVIDPALFVYSSGSNECWRAVVTIGAVDVSTSVTGVIRVEAEESTARIADFQMKPGAGAIDTTTWINQPVTIDYALFDPVTDLITTQIRVFGGTVDEPTYDPNTRLVSFKCSDNLQQELESMTRPQIDAITPGTRWTPLVFDEEADNYEYAIDRQSTFPASLDKNIGGSYEFTNWAAKVTPDYTFALSNIVDDSLEVELTSRREIVNRIDLTFGYGYDRLMQRERHVSWQFPGSFCEYLGNGALGINVGPFTIPNREMVEQAIDGTGWCAKSISYTKLPRSTTVFCSGAGLSIWFIGDELRNYLVLGFNSIIQKRFVKAVQEDFGIIITNADSIALYGQNNAERTASVRTDYDTSDWTQDDFCNDPLTGGFTTIPVPASPGSFEVPCDSYQDTDTLATDGTDRASVDFAIETEIARSRTEMLGNHRENIVSFDTPLFPIVARSHTIEIDTATVDARGKVSKFTHTMDLTSGQALTSWELAVSKAGGTTEVDSAITAPTPPDTVTPMIGLCEKPRLSLPTQYGGIGEDAGGSGALSLKSVPEPDPDDEDADQFTGYTGNKVPADAGAPVYGVKLAILSDEITDGEQDELVAENETPYTVAIPDELLNLFA